MSDCRKCDHKKLCMSKWNNDILYMDAYHDDYDSMNQAWGYKCKNFDDYRLHHQNKWIPCNERLPEDKQEVLCFVMGEFCQVGTFCKYDNGSVWVLDNGYRIKEGLVTHWMPLPEPPAEVRE